MGTLFKLCNRFQVSYELVELCEFKVVQHAANCTHNIIEMLNMCLCIVYVSFKYHEIYSINSSKRGGGSLL
jgi:hypothetical protein